MIIRNASADELQQIIVTAADEVTFDYFRKLCDSLLKCGEVFAAMIGDGDFGENRNGIRQAMDIDLGLVACDQPRFFHAFDPLKARTRR